MNRLLVSATSVVSFIAFICTRAVIGEQSFRFRRESFFDTAPESLESFSGRQRDDNLIQTPPARDVAEAELSHGVANRKPQTSASQNSDMAAGSGENLEVLSSAQSDSQTNGESTEPGPSVTRRPTTLQPPSSPTPPKIQSRRRIFQRSTREPIRVTNRPRPSTATITTTDTPINFDVTDGVIIISPLGDVQNQSEAAVQKGSLHQASSFISTGEGAAAGDANADTATELGSQQISDKQTNDQGTIVKSGSHGSGDGKNVRLTGAAQAKSQGSAQNNEKIITIRKSGGKVIIIPISMIERMREKGANMASADKVRKFQSTGDAISAGGGTVDSGVVSSNQDSSVQTDVDGTQSVSSNAGEGSGQNVAVEGSVQAASDGEGEQGQQVQGAENGSGVVQLQRGGIWRQNSEVAKESIVIKKGKSRGTGAAAGDATSSDGEALSVQNSQVFTADNGTRVQSSSVSRAVGKKLRLSGAATAGGSSSVDLDRGARFSFLVPLETSWGVA